MKINKYKVLSDIIERGIDAGYRKAYKHTDTPDEDHVTGTIYHYVMLEICEYFDFDDNDPDDEVTINRMPEDGC